MIAQGKRGKHFVDISNNTTKPGAGEELTKSLKHYSNTHTNCESNIRMMPIVIDDNKSKHWRSTSLPSSIITNVHVITTTINSSSLARIWNHVQTILRTLLQNSPGVLDTKSCWWFQPLWKIWKSIRMIISNLWENKTCSKPPTSYYYTINIPMASTVLFKMRRIKPYPSCAKTSLDIFMET